MKIYGLDMKKRIKIFSTALKSGKGGISTALVGYVSSLSKMALLEFVVTHEEGKKITAFLTSFKSAWKTEPGEICWFHMGPWFSMIRKLILIFICKIKKGVVVSHFHSPRVFDYLNKRPFKLLLSLIINLSDKVVVLTPWWKKMLSEAFPEHQHKFIISANPIDKQLSVLAQEKIRHERTDKINVLSMSRLEIGKGVDKTILAFKLLPDNFHLAIAGTGNQENALKDLVEKSGLSDRVSFLGWVNYESKIELLKKASVFCLPSKLDSFGMVYLEAMAANLPIVALNYQAIPDVVPLFAGVLADKDDAEVLADAIINASKMVFSSDELPSEYISRVFDEDYISKEFLKNVCN